MLMPRYRLDQATEGGTGSAGNGDPQAGAPQDPPAPATAPQPPAPPAAPAPPPQPPQAQPATPQGGSGPAPQRGTSITDPDVLRELLDQTRQEAADHRTGRREAEQQRDLTREELRQERIENAITAAAIQHGADTGLLVPFLQGSGRLKDINADDREELRTTLAELVAKVVEENPKLKAGGGTTPSPSSAPGTPPGGDKPQRTFTRAELAAMTPAQQEELRPEIDAWMAAGSPGIDG